jgi:hypothetical protein
MSCPSHACPCRSIHDGSCWHKYLSPYVNPPSCHAPPIHAGASMTAPAGTSTFHPMSRPAGTSQQCEPSCLQGQHRAWTASRGRLLPGVHSWAPCKPHSSSVHTNTRLHPCTPDCRPDTFSDYHGGSCGRCYEVRCRNSKLRDGYVSVCAATTAPLCTLGMAIL